MIEKHIKKFDARVLVVDDYIVNLELIQEMLELIGCSVDTAENGREALEYYQRNSYDMIMMDIQMPELDGLEATREIRRREGSSSHVPIIALTANALQGDEQKCLEAGMDGYLAKPVKIKDLEGVLLRFL